MNPVELLTYAAPVAYAALGETINEKGGVLNLGIEGTMLSAAFAAVLVSRDTGSPWVGLAAGMTVAVIAVVLQGVFVLYLAADQVVVGTAINLLALGVTGTLFRTIFGQSGELLSVPQIPSFAGAWDPLLVLLLLLVPGVWFLLYRTRWGLALRAAGEYPPSVRAAGYSVLRLRFQALLLGGLLGGIGGSYLALGIAGSFAENMTAGRGFVAIAMVTFGRWNPIGAFAGAILVGAAESLQFLLQAREGLQVPFQALLALPYALALLVLIGAGRGKAAPASLGIPLK